jgi:hypothetical protein
MRRSVALGQRWPGRKGGHAVGGELEPLGVVYEVHEGRDSNVWLYDGFHRLEGARRAGLAELPCEITHGTLKDARLLAARSNAEHGVRRDNEYKRNAVRTTLTEEPTWSDSRVAEHCLVGTKLVTLVRREMAGGPPVDLSLRDKSTAPGPGGPAANGALPAGPNRTKPDQTGPEPDSGEEPTRMRTGRDGRTINTANIGRRNACAITAATPALPARHCGGRCERARRS